MDRMQPQGIMVTVEQISQAAQSAISLSVGDRPRILYVTPEMSDYVKVGGLGDVAAALPRALRSLCEVRVLIPGYPSVLAKQDAISIVASLPAVSGIPACRIGRITSPDGLVIYVVICPELYDREGSPYSDQSGRDWLDNDVRFARLSAAAAEFAAGLGDSNWKPNFLHLNDWPTALAAGYIAWRGLKTPTLLTIHNLAYQGLFDPRRLAMLGIPGDSFRMDGVEFYGKLSFLKAGIFYASHLTTVSATYAKEVTDSAFGCGLDGLLRIRAEQGRLTGILNGIDDNWDPRQTKAAKPFQAGRWKSQNAQQVRKAFGLALSRGPLFAIVSRLVHQKGVDLAIEAAQHIVDNGGQLVVTGRGESSFERGVVQLADRHPGMVGARIGFDETEARQMFAGSDFLLMPSRFEPCGLSQMYAQKFGSLPIAHRTGGLTDTIEDGHTGFLFGEPTAHSFTAAISRALAAFRSKPRLRGMRRSAMARTFGWQQSALSYATLYQSNLQA
jgi:starch synthase